MDDRYETAVDYQLYGLIHKSQRYDDDETSKIQKLRKKVAVLMKHNTFNGQYSIFVINNTTEIKRPWDSSRIHEATTVWLFT